MNPAEIVRTTRQQMRLNVREFARLTARGLPSGCSTSEISHWENGRIRLNYEKTYYLYTHAPAPELQAMAAAILTALRPEQAARDVVS